MTPHLALAWERLADRGDSPAWGRAAAEGAAAAAGLRRFDKLLEADGAAVGPDPEHPERASAGGGERRLAVSRPPPGELLRFGKPSLAGAYEVLELMRGGRTICFAGSMWGRSVTSLAGDVVVTECESCHGGPRLGEEGCEVRRQGVDEWLPTLMSDGHLEKIKGWLEKKAEGIE